MAAAAYLAGLLMGLLSLLRGRPHSRAGIYTLIAVGYLLQTVGLFLRGSAVKSCPLGNSFEVFQFTAWAATSLYVFIGPVFRLSMLGFFTSSLAAVLTLLSLSIPSWDAARQPGLVPVNPWGALHAGLAMYSYGILAMLSLTSVLHLLRHHSLRSKRLGGWFGFLPPLVVLEQISTRLHKAAVLVLSLALLVGSLHWRLDSVPVSHLKLLAVVLVWSLGAGTLLLRMRGLLVGRRVALCCALLFPVALLSLWPVELSRHLSRPDTNQVGVPAP